MYEVTSREDFQNNSIVSPTWSSKELLAPGIAVYRDVLKKEINIINRLEGVLEKNKDFNWREALVGYEQKMPEYRDCVDFKFKKTDIEKDKSEESIQLQNLWQDIYDVKLSAVKDYSYHFRLAELKYWEAFNLSSLGK